MTASTAYIVPIVQVDDCLIADGKPGEVTQTLQGLYKAYAEEVA